MNFHQFAALAALLVTMSVTGCHSMQSQRMPLTNTFSGNSNMAQVTVKQTVSAPIDQVFASWHDEYGDVQKFHPSLSGSHLLDESPTPTGVGAIRQCNMNDGKNWVRERITDVQPNRSIAIEIYDGTMPLKSAQADIEFDELGPNETMVSITMNFEPKMGLIGKAMVPMMKMKFRPMLQDLMQANADYVERGVQVKHAVAMQ